MQSGTVTNNKFTADKTHTVSRIFNGAKHSVWKLENGEPVKILSEYDSTKVTDAFMTGVITGVKAYLKQPTDNESGIVSHPYNDYSRDLVIMAAELKNYLTSAEANAYTGTASTDIAKASVQGEKLKREMNRIQKLLYGDSPSLTP